MGSIGGDALKAGASGAAAGSAFGPWGAVIGAGVSALGSVAGNLIQGNASKKNAEQQQKYNKEILALQNTYNMDMFNKANEWNSPVNERARLEAAGINPLTIQGDAGEAAALQSAGALGYQQPMAVNPISGVFEHLGAIAQLENLRADTSKKTQESLTEVSRRENMKAELDGIRAEIMERLSKADLNEAERQIALKNLSWIDRINEANVARTESDTKLNDSNRNRIDELLEGEKIIQAKNIQEFEERWNTFRAAAEKDRALANLTWKDIENYTLNHLSGEFGGFNLLNLIRLGKEYYDEIGDAFKGSDTKGPPVMSGSSPLPSNGSGPR